MVFGSLKPKLKLGGFTSFIKSNEMIAVASAILITPVVMASVTSLISRVPFLRDNFAIGMIVASLVIFIISSMIGGIARSILLGISAGVLLVGIQSTTIAQNLLGRLEGAVP
jgi:hypothetical protein